MDAENRIQEYVNKVREIPLLTPTQETWLSVQAARFGVNRERVRQIEAEALHILLEVSQR